MNSRFSPAAVGAFEFVFRPWLRSRIHSILPAGLPVDVSRSQPLVLAANHISWWDAFVIRELQRAFRPGSPMYTLMTTAELNRFPFLRLLGVVEIDGTSQSSVTRSLRFLSARVTERPDSSVLIFPQGMIWPSFRRPLGFRRGVSLFAQHLSALIVPVGIHAEPLTRPTPTYFVSMGEILPADAEVSTVERCVSGEIDGILDLVATHGERTPQAWPAPRRRLEARTDIASPWR